MSNYKLDFWGFDTKEIKMESYKRFENSFFKDVYERALFSVEDMIDHIEEYKKDVDEEVNNIIAFTGERGTGKTTAMMSFVNYLQKDIKGDTDWKPDSIAKKYCFQCVPLIDPSKLTADENIITLVVAYIYENIKQMARGEKVYDQRSARNRIEKLKNGVRKCQEIYNVVRVKYTSFSKNIEQNPDTVETFSEIAKATRLRKLIQELVDEYLDILNDGNGNDSSVLIIPIDDLDTNIKNAYTMVEDIRSYFMVSKVIIMMAVKLEQLSDVIQLKFCEDFKYLPNGGQRMDSSPESMATKYIEKLISYDRRIAMPSLSLQSLEDCSIIIKVTHNKQYMYGTRVKEKQSYKLDSALIEEEKLLVDYVLSLLYKKTGIILVKNEQNTHEFIPCNLRTLHQLLQTLEIQKNISLQDITKYRNERDEKELIRQQQILLSNLETMYSFILDNSTSGNMPEKLVEILREIGHQSVETMNAFLVRNICRALDSTAIGEYIRDNPIIKNFVALGVHPHLVTIGDVLYLLNEVEQAASEYGIRQFIMSVKILYSIIMIRLLFTQGMTPQYSVAFQLLGSTICNPAIQLLPGNMGTTSYEWMPLIKGDRLTIKVGENMYTLDGKLVDIYDQEYSILSIKTAIKMSFFVLGFHRMKRAGELRQIDPHLYDLGDYPLVKYRRSAAEDINSALIAFHWISFISLALNPENTVKAMFHCLPEKEFFGSKVYNKLMKDILGWRSKNVCVIPIYSMDILNQLISDMHERRYEYDNGTAEDKRLHGYFCFFESLKASLKTIVNRTYLGDTSSVTDILDECPILFTREEAISRKLDDELKWLNI